MMGPHNLPVKEGTLKVCWLHGLSAMQKETSSCVQRIELWMQLSWTVAIPAWLPESRSKAWSVEFLKKSATPLSLMHTPGLAVIEGEKPALLQAAKAGGSLFDLLSLSGGREEGALQKYQSALIPVVDMQQEESNVWKLIPDT